MILILFYCHCASSSLFIALFNPQPEVIAQLNARSDSDDEIEGDNSSGRGQLVFNGDASDVNLTSGESCGSSPSGRRVVRDGCVASMAPPPYELSIGGDDNSDGGGDVSNSSGSGSDESMAVPTYPRLSLKVVSGSSSVVLLLH